MEGQGCGGEAQGVADHPKILGYLNTKKYNGEISNNFGLKISPF
jgi:hypothetical protein